MKIQNYSMDLQASSQKSSSIVTTFSDELLSQNTQRIKEMRSIQEEFEFIKQIQFELMNKLISMLSQKTPTVYEYSDIDISKELASFEKENFMYRKLSIVEETTISQSLDVSMQGFVQSGDKKIELSMNLSFSSEFTQRNTLEEISFYDPLVISFDGALPELDRLNFDFDIDMDGKIDQISMLKKGSGFLALDRDENGIINNGKELFGTQNGNGFLDLKRYDKDSNNWIDENDAIFDKLRIWSKNEGEDTLVGLGEMGVGAIFLGYAKGEFDLRSGDEVLGRIKSSGMYLNEDGTSGLLSQIDFAKQVRVLDQAPTPLSELLRA